MSRLSPLEARFVAATLLAFGVSAAAASAQEEPEIRIFLEVASQDDQVSEQALDQLGKVWRDGYASMLVDLARFMRPPREVTIQEGPDVIDEDFNEDAAENVAEIGSGALGGTGLDSLRAPKRRRVEHPTTKTRERIVKFLEKRTSQRFGQDLDAWRRWLWSLPYDPHPDYAVFKAALYGQAVDQNMVPFFMSETPPTVRLDEIEWGGVLVNGIPPLDHPTSVAAEAATYLADGDVVFGLVLDGEARAYPRRILAWHELARDRLGERELAIVYCTLCGTVIPYGAELGGRQFSFGTSGLLYRSNKLMFDAETNSLWSTSEGRPVVGALTGQPLELPAFPVVTTTWGEWRRAHPETTVLSLETGFERDYAEGAAYKEYFASPDPLFPVPTLDARLQPKDEVLALLMRPVGEREAPREATALSVAFLGRHPVHHFTAAGNDLVALTSAGGANRVYAAAGARFTRLSDDGGQVFDDQGQSWTLTEDALLPDGRDEALRRRVAARRAYWFGWYAQFPETALVK